MFTRRSLLKCAAALPAASFLPGYHALAEPMKGKLKIRDIRTMILNGPRTYTLVRIDTAQGPWGFAEAYAYPGAGVREQINALKPLLIGKDPLEIDAILTGLGQHTDGSAHSFFRAMAGIDMALYDLAGKVLNVPVSTLLGGRYRDKVRVYDHAAPRNMLDQASCRDWASKVKADKSGFTCHKFGPQHTDPKKDPGRDLVNRQLSRMELRNLRKGFENCREAVGWDHDIMVHNHWEYDVRTAMEMANAVESIQPVWLEDPMPVAYSEGWKSLCAASKVPICTGENWFHRADAAPFILNHGCDIMHPDLRNCGGYTETRKLADLAGLFAFPVANHNTGSIVNTMATIHWASAARDYIACETVCGKGDWMDEVILHDGPIFQGGFITVPNKPGIGIELNPDTVKAHLAEGEKWWG